MDNKCMWCNDTGMIPGDLSQMCPYCKIGKAMFEGKNEANRFRFSNHEQTKIKNAQLRLVVSLLNSMVNGGEKHTEQSQEAVIQALREGE